MEGSGTWKYRKTRAALLRRWPKPPARTSFRHRPSPMRSSLKSYHAFNENSYASTVTDSRGRTRASASGYYDSSSRYWWQHDCFAHSGYVDSTDGLEDGFWLLGQWYLEENGGFDGRWVQLLDNRPGYEPAPRSDDGHAALRHVLGLLHRHRECHGRSLALQLRVDECLPAVAGKRLHQLGMGLGVRPGDRECHQCGWAVDLPLVLLRALLLGGESISPRAERYGGGQPPQWPAPPLPATSEAWRAWTRASPTAPAIHVVGTRPRALSRAGGLGRERAPAVARPLSLPGGGPPAQWLTQSAGTRTQSPCAIRGSG